jgi:hypothetical protein
MQVVSHDAVPTVVNTVQAQDTLGRTDHCRRLATAFTKTVAGATGRAALGFLSDAPQGVFA